MKIVTARRFGLWWKLAQRWFKKQYIEAVAAITKHTEESIDTKIVPYLYAECSDEEIDRMFETEVTEDGLIVLPSSNLINSDGTMPIDVFTTITGLTPTE